MPLSRRLVGRRRDLLSATAYNVNGTSLRLQYII